MTAAIVYSLSRKTARLLDVEPPADNRGVAPELQALKKKMVENCFPREGVLAKKKRSFAGRAAVILAAKLCLQRADYASVVVQVAKSSFAGKSERDLFFALAQESAFRRDL